MKGKKIETRGEDSDDTDEIVDDIIEVDEDEETDSLAKTFDLGVNDTRSVIDSMELKAEAERVAEKLQIRIQVEKSDWRTHFSLMSQHQKNITTVMAELSPIINKVGGDVSKALQLIETREITLNSRFETSVIDYSTRAKALEIVEKKHRERVTTVNSLNAELANVSDRLLSTKNILDESQKVNSDTKPLMKIKTASTNLREEIKQLEIRAAILQRSLTQAWAEDKDSEE